MNYFFVAASGVPEDFDAVKRLTEALRLVTDAFIGVKDLSSPPKTIRLVQYKDTKQVAYVLNGFHSYDWRGFLVTVPDTVERWVIAALCSMIPAEVLRIDDATVYEYSKEIDWAYYEDVVPESLYQP